MNVEQLYEVLKKAQEPQGFIFNKDKQRVLELLQGLLTNKERYGYMCLPLPPGGGGPGEGSRHHLPLCLPGAGCGRVRQLLLQPLCFPGLERRSNAPRLGAGAPPSGEALPDVRFAPRLAGPPNAPPTEDPAA